MDKRIQGLRLPLASISKLLSLHRIAPLDCADHEQGKGTSNLTSVSAPIDELHDRLYIRATYPGSLTHMAGIARDGRCAAGIFGAGGPIAGLPGCHSK
jgi:hypothetical protein